MVETWTTPRRGGQRMALRAFRRETGRHMIWILCRLEIGVVAADARDRRTGILMLGDTRVTRLALSRCVTSDERKTRMRVALDHIGDPPRLT